VNAVAASSSDYAGVNPCCPACASGSAPRPSSLQPVSKVLLKDGKPTTRQNQHTAYYLEFVSAQTSHPWSRVFLRPCAVTALLTYNMTASKGKSSSTDPPSPSASFYDLSDDEEGEYNTIAHSSVGKGVKLLFSKSKVRCSATLGNNLQA
jgi:hypothetical protein